MPALPPTPPDPLTPLVPRIPFIRPARLDDLAAINDIYNHYVLHSTCTYQLTPSTLEERRDWFSHHGLGYPATVATASSGEVVGWASLSPFHPRPGWRFTVEDSVYIHHAQQRRGLGRALLADLLRRADGLGYRNVIGAISGDQSGSLALHAALGFVEVGRLKNAGFKFDQWLDVVYMQRVRPGA